MAKLFSIVLALTTIGSICSIQAMEETYQVKPFDENEYPIPTIDDLSPGEKVVTHCAANGAAIALPAGVVAGEALLLKLLVTYANNHPSEPYVPRGAKDPVILLSVAVAMGTLVVLIGAPIKAIEKAKTVRDAVYRKLYSYFSPTSYQLSISQLRDQHQRSEQQNAERHTQKYAQWKQAQDFKAFKAAKEKAGEQLLYQEFLASQQK